ncbi:MAG TPA: ATP-dependent 6-phosphofructokinase [Negativicutes bacterium]|nr:ATP-dependent 6-phosphofructokinase [Negativicutes bacterium]
MGKRRIAVLTSGGDAPGMNAALRAVTRTGIYHECEVFGVIRGYQGLVDGDFREMQANSVSGIIDRGGTILKSARCEQFKTADGFSRALRNIKQYDIDVVVVIGGDGSMAGARKLSEAGTPTIVIPATIDNDMPGTEYALGFDTALNNIVEAANKIRDTAFSHDRLAIIEVMGRHSGQLALCAGISCGAEYILIPEIPADIDDICRGLERRNIKGKAFSIIIVAEGVGRGHDIAAEVAARIPLSSSVTVLGYIQRGGNPTAKDNIVGSLMGAAAVDCVMAESYNCLIAMRQGKVLPVKYSEAIKICSGIDRAMYDLAGVLAT